MPRLVFDYVEGGAGREVATARNEAEFDKVTLQSRVMRQTSARSLATSFLGYTYQRPFGIAPMGMCNIMWPGADQMLARAAKEMDIPLCLSSAASSTIEEMRDWAGENGWFQLYVSGSVDVAMRLIDRAEKAGYDHLVLTVDVPQVARRKRDFRNGFQMPFRIGPRQFLDFARHPNWAISTLLAGAPQPRNFQAGFDRSASRAGADWHFLDVLRKRWTGKLIVKGITCAQDALRIRNAGADAVYVSNHGGRQLDASPAAISLLPAIRAAVGPKYPLIFDSGLRSGEDIARAMALGADFVMLGRPLLYAIGAERERGLFSLLRIIAEELDLTLAQLGLTSPGDISEETLAGACDADIHTHHGQFFNKAGE